MALIEVNTVNNAFHRLIERSIFKNNVGRFATEFQRHGGEVFGCRLHHLAAHRRAAGEEQVAAYEVNTEFVAGNTDDTDNSGILRYVEILNSGITMEQDKEINGLSLVGVGSGTTIDNVTVRRSDDDGIEIWGGTVDLSNCTVEYCTDDQFDIDDGYSGTVTNLTINQHTDGNAGIEMSGTTAATFIGLTLTQNYSDKEGAIFFKKDGIGGHFIDCEIIDNVDDGMTIYSQGDADEANISFEFVSITSPDTATNFTDSDSGGSAADIESIFDAEIVTKTFS